MTCAILTGGLFIAAAILVIFLLLKVHALAFELNDLRHVVTLSLDQAGRERTHALKLLKSAKEEHVKLSEALVRADLLTDKVKALETHLKLRATRVGG